MNMLPNYQVCATTVFTYNNKNSCTVIGLMNLKVLFKYSRIEKNLLAQAFKVRKFICFSVYFLDMDMCKYILFLNLNINSVQLINPLTH